jgi:hypothetical protein
MSHIRSKFAYRRTFAAVGLSALMVATTAAAAVAYPAGPGPNSGSDIVADRIHPQVKGVRIGIPIESGVVNTFAEARESVPEGDVGSLETYAQARESTAPELGGGLSTFTQARESVPAENVRSLPTFAAAREAVPQHGWSGVESFIASGYYVPQRVEDHTTFAQVRERAVPEADRALPYRAAHVFDPAAVRGEAGTFAQAREAITPRDAQWNVENFIASGYYVPQPGIEQGPYVALGSRHNVDALERMMDTPSEVAGTDHRPVADTDTSGATLVATILATAGLLVLVAGGVIVANRDRNLPTPV